MRLQDERVATIGHRLAINNLDLCTDRSWLPGGLGRSRASNMAPATGTQRFARSESGWSRRCWRWPRAVPRTIGAPSGRHADAAGWRSSFGRTRCRWPARDDGDLLDAIERAFADGSASVDLRRGAAISSVHVQAEPGCATRFQVAPSSDLNAADGRYVKVTTSMAYYLSDDQELAALLAHEFAHNMLRHRARLDSAGVARGFLGNFGRNARQDPRGGGGGRPAQRLYPRSCRL